MTFLLWRRETPNLFSTESLNVRACMSHISMLNLALRLKVCESGTQAKSLSVHRQVLVLSAVSLFVVSLLEFDKNTDSEANPNYNLMMRRVGLFG